MSRPDNRDMNINDKIKEMNIDPETLARLEESPFGIATEEAEARPCDCDGCETC